MDLRPRNEVLLTEYKILLFLFINLYKLEFNIFSILNILYNINHIIHKGVIMQNEMKL